MERKPIIINQRLPLHVLEVALVTYLNEAYSKDYILEQLGVEYQGENRIKKASELVNKVITLNPLNSFILEHKEGVLNALKKEDDRNIILIALVNSAFPFAFDTLSAFGKYFTVQDIISTEAIKKTISAIYGGNRSMENALYAIIPMFMEAGLFERQKPGIYEKRKLRLRTEQAGELYKRSFKINKLISPAEEVILGDPYFEFIVNETNL